MSAEQQTPQPRDRVRVVIDGVYKRPGPHDTWVDHVIVNEFGDHLSVPRGASVEVLERADDPSKDRIGTIRTCVHGVPSALSNRDVDDYPWIDFNENQWGVHAHREMLGCPVIGAVPGTPAAADTRPLWTGDGKEEPPAHVSEVVGTDRRHLFRHNRGWSKYPVGDDRATPWAWGDERVFGYYTEVRGREVQL